MALNIRLGRARRRVARGGLALLLVPLLGLLGWSWAPAPLAGAERMSYAAVSAGNDDLRGEVVAFNSSTGAVVRRIPAFYQPDIAVSPGGDRLFLLYSRDTDQTTTTRHILSLVDTRSWATLASTTLADRFLYNVSGPSTLALSPDGTRLFMYNSNAWKWDPVREPNTPLSYWLTVMDTASLQVLPSQIPLPNCGAARMALAAGQLVVLCGETGTVHFVDPRALRVVASINVTPRPTGLVVAVDQETVYVVTVDLSVVAISARPHTIARRVTLRRPQTPAFGSIPPKNGMAMSADGRYLIVGVMAEPRNTESAFALYAIDTTSLEVVKTVRLPRFAGIKEAPGGGLYLFRSGNSHATDWGIQVLPSDLSRATQLIWLDGPVYRLVP